MEIFLFFLSYIFILAICERGEGIKRADYKSTTESLFGHNMSFYNLDLGVKSTIPVEF